PQLDPELLRYHERDLEHIDRIEPEPLAIERCARIKFRGRHIEVQRSHDKAREFCLVGTLDIVVTHTIVRHQITSPEWGPISRLRLCRRRSEKSGSPLCPLGHRAWC